MNEHGDHAVGLAEAIKMLHHFGGLVAELGVTRQKAQIFELELNGADFRNTTKLKNIVSHLLMSEVGSSRLLILHCGPCARWVPRLTSEYGTLERS